MDINNPITIGISYETLAASPPIDGVIYGNPVGQMKLNAMGMDYYKSVPEWIPRRYTGVFRNAEGAFFAGEMRRDSVESRFKYFTVLGRVHNNGCIDPFFWFSALNPEWVADLPRVFPEKRLKIFYHKPVEAGIEHVEEAQ